MGEENEVWGKVIKLRSLAQIQIPIPLTSNISDVWSVKIKIGEIDYMLTLIWDLTSLNLQSFLSS
jgi:hypothetical protein